MSNHCKESSWEVILSWTRVSVGPFEKAAHKSSSAGAGCRVVAVAALRPFWEVNVLVCRIAIDKSLKILHQTRNAPLERPLNLYDVNTPRSLWKLFDMVVSSAFSRELNNLRLLKILYLPCKHFNVAYLLWRKIDFLCNCIAFKVLSVNLEWNRLQMEI